MNNLELREKVADILFDKFGMSAGRGSCIDIADQILALFPPQLTEEEILDIIMNHEVIKTLTTLKKPTISNKFQREILREDFKDLAQALIGKCATPTFSGVVKTPEKVAEDLISKLPNSYLHTEQKEYCGCMGTRHYNAGVCSLCRLPKEPETKAPVLCDSCHQYAYGKPIPAEKKGLTNDPR